MVLLNGVIRPIYPIPEAKEQFDTLSGSMYYSTLDLSSAYYQCEINENDKAKTAFATRRGQYEFNRMPFGLCGTPATFQRMKQEHWFSCFIYIDDVLLFANTFDEHLARVESITLS